MAARWTERHSTNIAFIDNHFVQKRKFYYSRSAINFPRKQVDAHSANGFLFFLLGSPSLVGRLVVVYRDRLIAVGLPIKWMVSFFLLLSFVSSGIDFPGAHPSEHRNESSGFCMRLSFVIFTIISTWKRTMEVCPYSVVHKYTCGGACEAVSSD